MGVLLLLLKSIVGDVVCLALRRRVSVAAATAVLSASEAALEVRSVLVHTRLKLGRSAG